ncbi:MAG TPA: aldolase catalytic domain-containing protein [bacterium]|nr:aldolase catalytic domain-containing protein [bacterium]HQO35735.1 aldolase catalytic domain-containing protein [bacterium]
MPDLAPWITFRPEIRVLDCTIRDGGLINDSRFDDGFVRAVYQTCVDAGIDYMEIGYKNSKRLFPKEKFGPWRHCDEPDLRRIVGDNNTPLKLSAMADAGKSDWQTDILPKSESVLDMIRVACYVNQIPEAVAMINDAHEKGYEVSCNIMAISAAQEVEIVQALEEIAQTPASVVVIVDSFGSLYCEQITMYVEKYRKALEGTGKEIGIHAHNNQQLAFANTIEAIIRGANRIDATMSGIGRGAGNCPMELLMGFLRNPKFRIRPVWQLLQDQFVKLSESLDWGPSPQYNMSGQLNQHPRTAMAARSGPQKHDYVDFYDKCVGDV